MNAFTKKTAIFLFALSPVLVSLWLLRGETPADQEVFEKVYVALEADGEVAVIDAEKQRFLRTISLAHDQDGKRVRYEAHNVQVTPDGSKVLVTANVNRGGMGERQEDEEDLSDGLRDRIFIIDPRTDAVVGSVELGVDLHLAHVVASRDGEKAYVNAQETGEVFVVDLVERKVKDRFQLGASAGPHGLRLTPDGAKLIIALLNGNAFMVFDLHAKRGTMYPLAGKAVQAAVTPDGEYAFASVYDSKEIAWVRLKTGERGNIVLPAESAGPVQLYPSPDSRFLYVADQGFYFDQPESNQVYRIRMDEKKVDQVIPAGQAPHGIVVDARGAFAYVTNLTGMNLSVIDLLTGKEVKRISVGTMPNGVSIWNKQLGGTP